MKIVSMKILFIVLGLALLGGNAWAQDTGYQQDDGGVIVVTPVPKKKPGPVCPSGWERGSSGLCQRSAQPTQPARPACKPGQKVMFNSCICKQPAFVEDGVCVRGPVWIHPHDEP